MSNPKIARGGYRIIVAHPGKQHSYRLASALKKDGSLLYYVTTIYDKDDSRLMKIIKKIVSKDNLKRAQKRKNQDLNDKDVVQYCIFGGLIEIVLSRMDKSHEIYRKLQRFDSDRFGIKVAKLAIKERADAVVMYDSNADAGFKYLKKYAPSIVRIQDVSIVPRPFMKKIYDREIRRTGHDDLRKENLYLWNPDNIRRMQDEIDNSQYFLAASHFVEKGLIECGVQKNQIRIVPYGANVESNIVRRPVSENQKVEFLFVGQVNYRKGISYLIDAMDAFQDSAHLTITGAYNSKEWFIKEAFTKRNISFTGLVTIDQMKEIYEQADVFVLPSFAEGMAQVGIEAMACGLPIICTFNSGDADLVQEGKNGFVIKAGDKTDLVEKMQWFIDHKDQISVMGNNAKKTAKNYTWENYEKNVTHAIYDVISKNEKGV